MYYFKIINLNWNIICAIIFHKNKLWPVLQCVNDSGKILCEDNVNFNYAVFKNLYNFSVFSFSLTIISIIVESVVFSSEIFGK